MQNSGRLIFAEAAAVKLASTTIFICELRRWRKSLSFIARVWNAVEEVGKKIHTEIIVEAPLRKEFHPLARSCFAWA